MLNCRKCKELLINFILMKLNALIVVILLMTSCGKDKKSPEVVKEVVEDVLEKQSETPDVELDIYDYAGFESFLNKKDDTIYVINFWATWCGPCVKELPYFEKLNSEYKKDNVKVILVSLDFPHLYEKRLIPFMAKHDLQSQVIALNDSNENEWISKIDASWSGSIPATIIYSKSKRKFFEKSFTYEELENEVKQFK